MDSNLSPRPGKTHEIDIDAARTMANSCQCVSKKDLSFRRNIRVIICDSECYLNGKRNTNFCLLERDLLIYILICLSISKCSRTLKYSEVLKERANECFISGMLH